MLRLNVAVPPAEDAEPARDHRRRSRRLPERTACDRRRQSTSSCVRSPAPPIRWWNKGYEAGRRRRRPSNRASRRWPIRSQATFPYVADPARRLRLPVDHGIGGALVEMHSHGHSHDHGHSHETGGENYAARRHPEHVVLDIGGDVGALIVHTDADMLGVEVEISATGQDRSSAATRTCWSARSTGARPTPPCSTDPRGQLHAVGRRRRARARRRDRGATRSQSSTGRRSRSRGSDRRPARGLAGPALAFQGALDRVRASTSGYVRRRYIPWIPPREAHGRAARSPARPPPARPRPQPRWADGHSHGLVHDSIKRSREGIRAVSLSLAVLALTAVAQTVVFLASGSIALLADLIHNFGDALTAVPLGIAFALRSKVAERRAGLAVVAAIFISACVAGVEAVRRLSTRRHPIIWRCSRSPAPSGSPATCSRRASACAPAGG